MSVHSSAYSTKSFANLQKNKIYCIQSTDFFLLFSQFFNYQIIRQRLFVKLISLKPNKHNKYKKKKDIQRYFIVSYFYGILFFSTKKILKHTELFIFYVFLKKKI